MTGVSLVEWADRVAGLLPDGRWTIALEPTGPTARGPGSSCPPSPPELADRLAERLSGVRTATRPDFDARDRLRT